MFTFFSTDSNKPSLRTENADNAWRQSHYITLHYNAQIQKLQFKEKTRQYLIVWLESLLFWLLIWDTTALHLNFHLSMSWPISCRIRPLAINFARHNSLCPLLNFSTINVQIRGLVLNTNVWLANVAYRYFRLLAAFLTRPTKNTLNYNSLSSLFYKTHFT